MFRKKFQVVTQVVGTITLAFLAVYGLLAMIENSAAAWAQGPEGAQEASGPSLDSSEVSVSVPQVMNYQGDVKDAEGNPLDGSYDMSFRIYSDVVAGSALWQEQHQNVTVRAGRFSVLLGNTTSLPETLFDQSDRFIGVTVDPYEEMVPRQRFASVPYAMQANDAINALHADHAFALTAPDGSPKDALVATNDGQIKWGTHRGLLKTDQGASIELGGQGEPYLDFSNDTSTDYDMRFTLTGDDALSIQGGNVGIGKTPSQKLDVSGNINATQDITADRNITANGKIKMTSQTSASDSSDTVVTKGYVDSALIPQGFGIMPKWDGNWTGNNFTCPPGFTLRVIHYECDCSNNANIPVCYKD